MPEEPLDAQIARVIFRHDVEYCWEHVLADGCRSPGCGWVENGGPVRGYSSDIAAAWTVLERLRELGYTNISVYTEAGGWEVELCRPDGPSGVVGLNSPTAPLAICRAALLALGRERAD